MADHDDRPRLEQAELFAPGLIHEMRHPLMGIKAGLQLIGRQMGEVITQHEEWQLVAGQLARLEELFRSYQDFLDPDNQLPRKFAVSPVVQRAISLLQYRLKKLEGRFRADLGEAPLYAWGTPNTLLHAVINLLVNAADAVEELPSARVTLRLLASAEGGVQVRVSDEGQGISPEVRARIFEARFTTKPNGKGTGLGLHIARRVMSGFGGTVSLVDEGEAQRLGGARTEFCIALPPPPAAPHAIGSAEVEPARA